MEGLIIGMAAAVVAAAAIWFVVKRSGSAGAPDAAAPARAVPAPPVAEFDLTGDTATVSFEVPLPETVDDVLQDLLLREAVEVVREKRHDLPIDGLHRVVARGRRAGGWVEVGSLSLETPGSLPAPSMPTVLPGRGSDRTFDPFETMDDLPEHAPGLADGADGDTLAPIGAELRIPAALEAGLRSQGIEPTEARAHEIVIGILRLTGSAVTEKTDDTLEAMSGGRRTMIRLVPHDAGEHPELSDAEVRRFAADFASSGADRALLITQKYSPFEIYDRERREPRARYITRERMQAFIDALALS